MSNWDLVEHRVKGKDVCLIFIHGFGGDAAKTWAEFPKFIEAETRLADWDIVSFGYESDLMPDGAGLWTGDPEIRTIADQLRTFWKIKLGNNYRGVALVAHSMGGLVVQRALVDDDDFTAHVSHLFLFGTPSAGLWKAWPFRLPLLRRLKRTARDMGKGSDFIKDLRERWSLAFGNALPFGFSSVAGAEDEFVPRTSSLDPFPTQYQAVIPGTHLSIVKPETTESPSVELVVQGIAHAGMPKGTWNAIPEFNAARMAAEKLDFNEVVKRLGPKLDDLDEAALVDLALALDSLGKREEAIAALERPGKKGTDAMGVLAGRLKRNWVWDRREADAERAAALYLEAYKIAEGEANHAQAYYHGINVAFMQLAYRQDRETARAWAGKVLDHCHAAAATEKPSDRLWRLATEGEAFLMLGERRKAGERYRAAVAENPKPWQLASMYGQAIRGADELEDEEAAKELLKIFGEAPR